jgi:hypothetical protein
MDFDLIYFGACVGSDVMPSALLARAAHDLGGNAFAKLNLDSAAGCVSTVGSVYYNKPENRFVKAMEPDYLFFAPSCLREAFRRRASERL